ncbi:ABC transporter ATP-binding protein [Colwellia piezophila]|uniref:ABC transporter ATP-binding protein n=1 Tax=Colwellia piezophila TaxID=211668 RepID=UPI0003773C17|nr:ABC transporter ATP-binding protein [Colwellia piezophila]
MTTIINIENLTKSYKKQQVLTGVNWKIQQGDVVGLLGKNGAGKSTLLKSLLNMNEVDSGTITIFGEPHKQLTTQSKALIGYVPQENDEISWLSVRDLINFRKQFYPTWSDEKVTDLIGRWEIDITKKMAELSPGQVQRVLIILALAPMPKLLIFDEPAAALDPAGRRDFLKEILTLVSDEDITVIFSTHITSDLERIANKVAILDKGQICYFNDLDATKENVVQLTVHCKEEQNITIPNLLRGSKFAKGQYGIVSKLDKAWLTQMQNQAVEVTINPMGLEDIFLELTA